MANGDAAAAAGMDTVAGNSDLRLGYDEMNKILDYLAAHMTAGTHDAGAIVSGILALARIPTIPGTKVSGPVDLSGNSLFDNLGVRVQLIANSAILGPTEITGQLSNATAYASVVTSGRTLAVRADGTFGYFPSARRFKKNFKPFAIALGDVLALADRIVEYDFKKEYGGGHDIGLPAEDVAELFPFLAYPGEEEGQVDGYDKAGLVIPLLAAVKALAARVAELEKGRD